MNSPLRSAPHRVKTLLSRLPNISTRLRLVAFSFSCTIISLSSLKAQQAILTGGGIHQNDVASIQWALGEVMTESFAENNLVITQGIHQPSIIVTAISSTESDDLKVFPNPVQDHLLIISQQNRAFTLVDELSRTVTTGESQKHTSIDFTELPCGMYILSIATPGGSAKTFRIIKKQ